MQLLLEQREKDMPSLLTDSESEGEEEEEDNLLLSHLSNPSPNSDRPPMTPPGTPKLEIIDEEEWSEKKEQAVASTSSASPSEQVTRQEEKRHREFEEANKLRNPKRDRKEVPNLEAKTKTLVVLDSNTLAKIIHGSVPLENRITKHQIWRLEKHRWNDYHDAFGEYGPYTPQPPRSSSLWVLSVGSTSHR